MRTLPDTASFFLHGLQNRKTENEAWIQTMPMAVKSKTESVVESKIYNNIFLKRHC